MLSSLWVGIKSMSDGVTVRASEIAPGRHWAVGKYALAFTGAGNLEVWNRKSSRLLWQSGTRGAHVARMVMQDDGNLVIYDRKGRPMWSSGTHGNDSAYLALQEDGNVVIYSQDRRPLWHTATYGG